MDRNFVSIDANISKICAFCKHWYDPTYAYIKPKFPKNKIWYFDKTARAQCLKHGIIKNAQSSCPKFESRV